MEFPLLPSRFNHPLKTLAREFKRGCRRRASLVRKQGAARSTSGVGVGMEAPRMSLTDIALKEIIAVSRRKWALIPPQGSATRVRALLNTVLCQGSARKLPLLVIPPSSRCSSECTEELRKTADSASDNDKLFAYQ